MVYDLRDRHITRWVLTGILVAASLRAISAFASRMNLPRFIAVWLGSVVLMNAAYFLLPATSAIKVKYSMWFVGSVLAALLSVVVSYLVFGD